jgi:signal transduction histidine kinase
LLILAYRSLRIKQKANAVIKEKNEKLEFLYKEVEHQRKSIEEQKDEIASQNEELSTTNQYLQDLNHEKNSLMGIVAHDLRSPLNSIGGITDMLPRLGPLNDGQKEFVSLINNVVEGSRALIQDLMDLSALENKELKIHPSPISINKLLESCQQKYAGQAMQKDISFNVVEKTDNSVLVLSDSQHIDRILQNLVSNALKFSNPGTRVTMGSRIQENQIQFYVKDQGPGISEDDQKYLFKKFVKLTARPTKGESSSGLGLSIVKALVEELGGTIKVESELKKGTTFIVSLPLK